jgi:hypothetical protein
MPLLAVCVCSVTAPLGYSTSGLEPFTLCYAADAQLGLCSESMTAADDPSMSLLLAEGRRRQGGHHEHPAAALACRVGQPVCCHPPRCGYLLWVAEGMLCILGLVDSNPLALHLPFRDTRLEKRRV